MKHVLRLSGTAWLELRQHLFPSDGLESVALLLCGIHRGADVTALTVRRTLCIPDAAAVRTTNSITWPTHLGLPLFEEALREGCAVVKIHSHPGGFDRFSATDDLSDSELLDALSGWTDEIVPHGSAVMLPGGRIIGRVLDPKGGFAVLDRVAVAGADLHFFDHGRDVVTDELDLRNVQAFGEGTVRVLKSLRIGVAGCSGTGSWIVEMLARLGVGELVLVDPDVVKRRNLNRIVNSRKADADAERPKVEVLRDAVEAMGFGTRVRSIRRDLRDPEAILALAGCDVLFGGFDSADGRDLLNRIATFYCLPYFDVGVRLDADKKGGIDYIGGACHYVQPGRSSLLSRGVITVAAVSADSLHRHDPEEYHKRRKAGYIHNVEVESPAVCSVNGLHAALAVNDFLGRIHPFRYNDNTQVDALISNLSGSYLETRQFAEVCPVLGRRVGFGDRIPLLDLPGL